MVPSHAVVLKTLLRFAPVTPIFRLMCGILLRVSCSCSIPAVISKSIKGDIYESQDEEEIFSTFIEPSIRTQLSPADERKLSNISKLKEVDLQLKRAKNQVKHTKESILLVELLTNEIASLSGENEPPLLLHKGDIFEELLPLIAQRGPNYVSFQHQILQDYKVQTFSSVLSLRSPFTPQPVRVLGLQIQFNGELYNTRCLSCNDTAYLCDELEKNIEKEGKKSGIVRTVAALRGEYALAIYDPDLKEVYFCRDLIGRRSLTFKMDPNAKEFILSSVAGTGFAECDTKCIHLFSWDTFEITQILREDYLGTLKPLPFRSDSCNGLLDIDDKLSSLHSVLNRACEQRQKTIHPLHFQTEEANMAILFSGGLDCTILAALIAKNRILTEGSGNIDLLTVGFENPRTGLQPHQSPDRMLSKKSWFHLCKLFDSPTSRIRLVEVDVSYREWLAHRQKVRDLMYPAKTEMDLSIAVAFYFASRGGPAKKWLLEDTTVAWGEFCKDEATFATVENDYNSQAKVLFSGLGADELFAGYSRHEGIFNGVAKDSTAETVAEAYRQLNDMLLHDISVIESRNLGRDDRVISCWGKELRYPYLDESVVLFVTNEVGPNLKVRLNWENDKKVSRKWILRQLALQLGLIWVADEAKRAIQFGAKSAKMEVGQGRKKGTDRL